jgi:hypothetical protein
MYRGNRELSVRIAETERLGLCGPVKRSDLPAPMQDYYAARAPEYDRIYLNPERQPDLRSIEQCVREQFAGSRVLRMIEYVTAPAQGAG